MKKFFLLILAIFCISGMQNIKAQVLASDSLALVDIYNDGDGPNWTNATNWLTGPVSTWAGVVVTGDRVTELSTEGLNMGGVISPSVGQLSELVSLKIIGLENPVTISPVSGSIPVEIYNLTKLKKLQIKFTMITGGIPAGVEGLVSLEEINFQQTYLGGSIPPEVFELPNLTKAYLHQSNFTGTVPATATGATQLSRFYVHDNKLTGPLPFINLPKANAAKVNLNNNFFSYADVKQYHDSAANYTLTDDYQLAKEPVDTLVNRDDAFAINGAVANGEAYAWFKDAGTVPVGTNAALPLNIQSLSGEGSYMCKAQSSLVSNFDIRTIYNIALNVIGFERDSLALVDIYNAGDGPNWTNATNWLTGPVSTWAGVVVTGDRVTELSTEGLNMGGVISPSVGQLSELTSLKIIGLENPVTISPVSGTIPPEIYDLSKLKKLQIKYTMITGGIPAGVEGLVSLEEINFQQTYLGGSIPPEVFELPNLTKAYLHQSNFTGTVPATATGATQLSRFYVHDNKLTGPLPFINLPKANAAKVNLNNNFFSFADVKQYHDSAANYTLTDDYQLAKAPVDTLVNKGEAFTINGTVANGEAYAWFKDAGTVPVGTNAALPLSIQSLSGEGSYLCKAQSSLVSSFDIRTIYNVALDVTASEHDSLALVDIYNDGDGPNWTNATNWLTGPVSTWAGVVVTDGRVTELSTEGLNMGGVISPSVGQLSELTSLKIIGLESPVTISPVSGTIPPEIYDLSKLKKLQIKYTMITGGIPAGVEGLTSLEEINFQQTYLGGSIPPEVFELPNLTKAYLHQSNFTGTVPSTVTGATKLSRLYVHDNKLTGPLPFVNLPKANAAKVNLNNNFFSFADVKQYHDSAANYTLTDDYQLAQEPQNLSLTEGDPLTLKLPAIENGEMYTWLFNNAPVSTSVDTALVKASVSRTDTGEYVCKVQSSLVSAFDIRAVFTVDEVIAIPAFVSGSTNEAGTQITLEFDYEIADPSAETASFTVKQDNTTLTVASVVSSGSDARKIILNLSSAITSSTASIQVSYTPGALKGTTGGPVEAFGPVAVTNNVLTSINESVITESIYPNPFTDKIWINSSSVIKEITLIDITGKAVISLNQLSEKSFVISTADLENGIYFISIKTLNSNSVQKIVKR